MKKVVSLALLLTLALTVFCACGSKEISVDGLSSEILSKVKFDEELVKVEDDVAKLYYGIEDGDAEEFQVYMSTAAFVDEVSVWKTKDVNKITEKINARIAEQKESYADYRPDEVPKLDKAVIITSGDVVVCCITSDSDNAKEVINSYIK